MAYSGEEYGIPRTLVVDTQVLLKHARATDTRWVGTSTRSILTPHRAPILGTHHFPLSPIPPVPNAPSAQCAQIPVPQNRVDSGRMWWKDEMEDTLVFKSVARYN